MPAHGTAPDEVLDLFTKAGGSWWLAIATERPTTESTTVDLADIPPLELARTGAVWADAADGQVSPADTQTMPAAAAETTAAAWVLFNDEACTDMALSRWFDEDRLVPEGHQLQMSPELLTIEFTPSA